MGSTNHLPYGFWGRYLVEAFTRKPSLDYERPKRPIWRTLGRILPLHESPALTA